MTRLLLILLAFTTTGANAQYVGFNNKEIRQIKEHKNEPAYQALATTASQALDETPNPIDTIRTEGLLAGNPKKTATQAALKDMNKIYALALAYRVQGDRKFLKKATRFLLAWANSNHPNGDPIDDTNLDRCIEAYDMVKDQLSKDDYQTITAWLQLTAQTELRGRHYRPERPSFYNNWHSHRLKIVGEIAFAIGDTALQGYTIRELKIQLEKNLNPDGSSVDFALRDALHYHVYDLEPLLKLIIVLQRATGTNYYAYTTPAGASVKRSVDWLLPWLNGQKTHPEFVNSTVDFDRKRAQNNEAAYKAGTLFEAKNGIQTLYLAAWFDPSLLPLAQELSGKEGQTGSWLAFAISIMHKGQY
jgi:hypothetical protein